MVKGKALTAALTMVCTSSAAVAGDKVVVQPIQVGAETVRYQQGVATLDLQMRRGAVQLTPLPLDHGSLSFAVAVWNASDQPANIDIGNFDIHAGSQALPVFSKDQLESKAKNRAMWASIALAAVSGIGAAAAASQRDHYRSTLVTPHGTYRAFYSAPSTAGQVQAAALVAGGAVGLARIQEGLDQTRAALGQNIVQMTTVDPSESYAGQIVLTKIKAKDLPQRVDIRVKWNGEEYPFAFQLAKRGAAAPAFTALTPPPPVAPVSQPSVETTPATMPTTTPVAAGVQS